MDKSDLKICFNCERSKYTLHSMETGAILIFIYVLLNITLF